MPRSAQPRVAMLPDHVTHRTPPLGGQTPPLANNAGIAALGVADAASGAFDRVDVRIEIAGTSDAGITISLGGQALDQAPTTKKRLLPAGPAGPGRGVGNRLGRERRAAHR